MSRWDCQCLIPHPRDVSMLYLDFLAAPDVFLTPGRRRWLITLLSSWSVFAAGGAGAADIGARLIKLNTSHIWWMADAITVGHFTRRRADEELLLLNWIASDVYPAPAITSCRPPARARGHLIHLNLYKIHVHKNCIIIFITCTASVRYSYI